MEHQIHRIGVLTSGGDAPGMNAAVRAVVRTAVDCGIECVGIRRGWNGLINSDFVQLDASSVSHIINKGGTVLYTARSEEFMTEPGRAKALSTCKLLGLDAIVAIGGDGTFRGALALSRQAAASGYGNLQVVGIPATIDNDIGCSHYTIGFDTACNTAMEAIDKVRDTSASHERCSIIEVMGRTAGHIALWCGISNGSEYITIPERYDNDEQKIIEKIRAKRRIGKKHHIIVNAEGVGNSYQMAKDIEEATGIETRATVIGHIQRGGNPSCRDRVYASSMGAMAVDLLIAGKTNRVVAYRSGKFCDFDIDEALAMTKDIDEHLYSLTMRLSR